MFKKIIQIQGHEVPSIFYFMGRVGIQDHGSGNNSKRHFNLYTAMGNPVSFDLILVCNKNPKLIEPVYEMSAEYKSKDL